MQQGQILCGCCPLERTVSAAKTDILTAVWCSRGLCGNYMVFSTFFGFIVLYTPNISDPERDVVQEMYLHATAGFCSMMPLLPPLFRRCRGDLF